MTADDPPANAAPTGQRSLTTLSVHPSRAGTAGILVPLAVAASLNSVIAGFMLTRVPDGTAAFVDYLGFAVGVLLALAVACQVWSGMAVARYTAWVDGTELVVRGTLRTSRCDLATVQGLRVQGRQSGNLPPRRLRAGPDARGRSVKVNLVAPRFRALPGPQYAAVADAIAAGPREGRSFREAYEAVDSLRRAAGNPRLKRVPARDAPTASRTVSAVVVLALTITVGGVGGWLAGTRLPRFVDTSGAPDGLAWSAPYRGPESEMQQAVGSWLVGGVIVRGSFRGVRAYDLRTGGPAWHLSPGGSVCGMSPTTSQGVGAVLYREAESADLVETSCDHLAVVDVRTGERLWSLDLAGQGAAGARSKVTDARVAMAGGVTVVMGQQSGVRWVRAFAISGGQRLWQYSPRGGGCAPSNVAVSPQRILLTASCSKYESEPSKFWRTLALDPRTGHVRQRIALEPESLFDAEPVPVSAAPPVIAVGETVVSLDGSGEVRTRFSMSQADVDLYDLTLRGSADSGRTSVLMTAESVTVGDGFSPWIASYDLASGERRWRAPIAADGLLTFVGTRGERLVALMRTEHVYQYRLVRIGPGGELEEIRSIASEWEAISDSKVYARDGRFYFVSWQLSPGSSAHDEPSPAVMAIKR